MEPDDLTKAYITVSDVCDKREGLLKGLIFNLKRYFKAVAKIVTQYQTKTVRIFCSIKSQI